MKLSTTDNFIFVNLYNQLYKDETIPRFREEFYEDGETSID